MNKDVTRLKRVLTSKKVKRLCFKLAINKLTIFDTVNKMKKRTLIVWILTVSDTAHSKR